MALIYEIMYVISIWHDRDHGGASQSDSISDGQAIISSYLQKTKFYIDFNYGDDGNQVVKFNLKP